MKKVFIMTPMLINDTITSDDINTYIRKASGAAEAIIGEEIEVETNFFLEPVGTDKDGEVIMQVRNADDEIAYIAEELAAMEKCDYIIVSSSSNCDIPFSCAYEVVKNRYFNMFRMCLKDREIMALPIDVIERKRLYIEDEFVNSPCRRPYNQNCRGRRY